MAESLRELASLDRIRGRYDEAVKRQREVLAIHEKVAGPDSEPVADALTQLALILFLKGEYDEAERIGRRARQGVRSDRPCG